MEPSVAQNSTLPSWNRQPERTSLLLLALVAGPLTILPVFAEASIIAFDSAADAAYNDGWQTGDNGGFGWGGGWSLSHAGVSSGQFVGSSTLNGNGDSNGDGDIDTPAIGGRSWGLSATGSTGSSFAQRALQKPLTTGQTLHIDMDNGSVFNAPGREGSAAFALLDASYNWLFAFELRGGAQTLPEKNYWLTDYTSHLNYNMGIASTDEGLGLSFSMDSPDTYSFVVTPRGGAPTSFTGTLRGTPKYLVLRSTTPGALGDVPSNDNLYFNNMAIESPVPEPSTWMLFAIGLTTLLAACRPSPPKPS